MTRSNQFNRPWPPRLPLPGANARHLTSRNKREGGYMGWRVLTFRERLGHQRRGASVNARTLREWLKWSKAMIAVYGKDKPNRIVIVRNADDIGGSQ